LQQKTSHAGGAAGPGALGLASFLLSKRSMWPNEWNRISKNQLVGFGVGMGVFLGVLLASEPGFVFLLDHANLLFHEAGHPLIGFFCTPLEPYGGTIGQLAFPIILAVSCWRKGQVLGFAASLIWFFENWLNIARYMADARKLQLPLVGGGDQDWNTILARWDILMYDTRIADGLKTSAWIGFGVVCVWVTWRGARDWSQEPEPRLSTNL
jgi:hypothetical protein